MFHRKLQYERNKKCSQKLNMRISLYFPPTPSFRSRIHGKVGVKKKLSESNHDVTSPVRGPGTGCCGHQKVANQTG